MVHSAPAAAVGWGGGGRLWFRTLDRTLYNPPAGTPYAEFWAAPAWQLWHLDVTQPALGAVREATSDAGRLLWTELRGGRKALRSATGRGKSQPGGAGRRGPSGHPHGQRHHRRGGAHPLSPACDSRFHSVEAYLAKSPIGARANLAARETKRSDTLVQRLDRRRLARKNAALDRVSLQVVNGDLLDLAQVRIVGLSFDQIGVGDIEVAQDALGDLFGSHLENHADALCSSRSKAHRVRQRERRLVAKEQSGPLEGVEVERIARTE